MAVFRFAFVILNVGVTAVAMGCSSDSKGSSSLAGDASTAGASSGGASQGGASASGGAPTASGGSAGASGASTASGGAGPGGASATGGSATNSGGATSTGGAGTGGTSTTEIPDGSADVAPPGFWDTSNIPPAKNVMTFKFLNRTNGKYQDGEIYWSINNQSAGISELHSIAAEPTYDMPANASGRMYFYICATGDTTCASDPTKSKYFDFIEHTIGATQYNGNTTRVDAFGLKIAMRLHCSDGYDVAVGEDYATFAEDRTATFQKFVDFVPDAFKPLAEPPNAPYRIVEPGADGFGQGGQYATYYDSFVDELWSANGLTIAKPGPNGSNLAAYPDVSAAIYRHVGNKAGSFDDNGKLLDKTLWNDASTFYTAAPADYYAEFWHLHALGGKAYGFPYDDVGGYSSYISHKNPEYMLVAVGW